MYDILDRVENKTIKCLDKGFVTLVDAMPRLIPDGQTADYAIVQMARVSYGEGTKTINDDASLINYLMRHQHTSPFEAISFKFHIKMPLFCARQWVRHRTANYYSTNEISGRYSVMKDEFYIPETCDMKHQSQLNKQAGDKVLDEEKALSLKDKFINHGKEIYALYEEFIDSGLCREQSRSVLPLNLYTEFYWKQDLHNLLHLLALRCDHHTQYETRVFADAILSMIKNIVPLTINAWEKYHPKRNAVVFTGPEVEAMKKYFSSLTEPVKIEIEHVGKSEKAEWLQKLTKLGVKGVSV